MESVCFFVATWLFSVKYYESASDLKIMLSDNSHKWESLVSRKRKCKIYRWAVLALLFSCQILECIASTDKHLSKDVAKVIFSIGFSVISITIFVMSGLIGTSLFMLTRLVSRTTQLKQDLNILPIVLQIVGLLLWTGTWLGEGAIFLFYFRASSSAYIPFRNLIIIDTVSFVMNLDIFLMIAFVLYKSSSVAGTKSAASAVAAATAPATSTSCSGKSKASLFDYVRS